MCYIHNGGLSVTKKTLYCCKAICEPIEEELDLNCTCTHAWITLRDSNNYTFKFTFLRVTAVNNLTSFSLTS